ncbi:MAG: NAD(P)-dependent oxidoreductase [Clostridia bacterium]|nr:NAD(P)-dependent oxidoreductase [Clostridia bacterium]
MKKMLIVGGAGYLGGYMTDVFMQRAEYEVTVYDNLLYETRYLKDVPFIYGDVTDTEKLGAIVNDFDIVVWLAAIVGDGACAVDPALTEKVNYGSVKWLVDHYKGTIVFMSTCSVYGMNNDLIDEDAAPNPLSVYAETKIKAEMYVRENSADYLIFRLGTLYGLGDPFSRVRFDLVVNVLTLRAVQGLPLTVFGGEQWRPILHVRDVAHAIEYCLDHDVRGLYNLSERNTEINALAEQIATEVPGTTIVRQEMKYEDLRDYKVKHDRILSTGWRPQYTLEEGIRQMARVIAEHRVCDPADPIYSNVAYLKSILLGD